MEFFENYFLLLTRNRGGGVKVDAVTEGPPSGGACGSWVPAFAGKAMGVGVAGEMGAFGGWLRDKRHHVRSSMLKNPEFSNMSGASC